MGPWQDLLPLLCAFRRFTSVLDFFIGLIQFAIGHVDVFHSLYLQEMYQAKTKEKDTTAHAAEENVRGDCGNHAHHLARGLITPTSASGTERC